ncbi:MAG: (d)CMP kinase [Bacillota bacterium]
MESAGSTGRPSWVAVDGPAGAGKSTLARALARELGFRYVDTGATYRAAALAALEAGLSPDDPAHHARIVELVRSLDLRLGVDPNTDGPTPVFLNGRDVSAAVRSLEVGQAASSVARIPEVRHILAGYQRHLAEEGPCVMDGRDIGTVVLPEAPVKLFVTASLEERARRRAGELLALGEGQAAGDVDLGALTEQLKARDQQDTSRSASPLMAAPDAVTLDTTGQDFETVLRRALLVCRERLGGGD